LFYLFALFFTIQVLGLNATKKLWLRRDGIEACHLAETLYQNSFLSVQSTRDRRFVLFGCFGQCLPGCFSSISGQSVKKESLQRNNGIFCND
jgi:hypothetical protein